MPLLDLPPTEYVTPLETTKQNIEETREGKEKELNALKEADKNEREEWNYIKLMNSIERQ
jgi:hypothetical protein